MRSSSCGTMPLARALLLAAASAAGQRLRITNGCDREPLWVAHMAGADNGPDPQNARLEPGEHHDFDTHDGLSSTRYWPKMRCNEQGSKCLIGESGGPGQECDKDMGCAPPIDSKFEGTFGTEAGIDWIDVSLVDGWTLPFKFKMTLRGKGKCNAGDGNRSVMTSVDCSTLTLDKCPSHEVLNSKETNLQVIHPGENQVVGCYSPCAKLTSNNWDNELADGVSPADDRAVPYCCPTPPESPEACRTGPVEKTSFVRAVHKNCPGVYGYSYDDGMGLITCPKDTKYEMIFYCPDGEGEGSSEPVEEEEPSSSEEEEEPSEEEKPKPTEEEPAEKQKPTEASEPTFSPFEPGRKGPGDKESEKEGSALVAFLLEQEQEYPFHEYCGDKHLFEGVVAGQLECQDGCRKDDSCGFYSYWGTGHVHWCRQTASCESRKSDKVENVTMFKKVEFDRSTTAAPVPAVCCFEDDSVDDPCSSGCLGRTEVGDGFCVPRETWCDSCTEDSACQAAAEPDAAAAEGGSSKEGQLMIMRKDAFRAFVSEKRGGGGGRSPALLAAGALVALVAGSALALKLRWAVARHSATVVRVERAEGFGFGSQFGSPGLGTPSTVGSPMPPPSSP